MVKKLKKRLTALILVAGLLLGTLPEMVLLYRLRRMYGEPSVQSAGIWIRKGIYCFEDRSNFHCLSRTRFLGVSMPVGLSR